MGELLTQRLELGMVEFYDFTGFGIKQMFMMLTRLFKAGTTFTEFKAFNNACFAERFDNKINCCDRIFLSSSNANP